jgi:hypothetical protein
MGGRLALVSAAAMCIAAMVAAPANAGLLVTSGTDCADQPMSQPFAPWGDHADYTPLPGSFEVGEASWSLSGAGVTSGNEPYYVNQVDDTRSLRLDSGEAATSKTICVGLEHPTLRLFARSSGTGLLSAMTVEVITQTSLGLKLALPIGVVLPSGAWKPTPRFVVLANLLPLLPGERTPVAFRFRAAGGGSWWIDDVYVDPMRRQ